MKKIAVIGAGTMGNGIAHVFAQNGFEVNLIDTQSAALDKALQTIAKNLDRQVAKAIIQAADKDATLAKINCFTNLKEGVHDRDLVIEAATENSKIKLAIFSEIDQYTHPTCILASNTSSISITQLANATQKPGNVIGMHFMNPVPVMKLVRFLVLSKMHQDSLRIEF